MPDTLILDTQTTVLDRAAWHLGCDCGQPRHRLQAQQPGSWRAGLSFVSLLPSPLVGEGRG